jgi:hypothetical protein
MISHAWGSGALIIWDEMGKSLAKEIGERKEPRIIHLYLYIGAAGLVAGTTSANLPSDHRTEKN